jgi:hypothetical protein
MMPFLALLQDPEVAATHTEETFRFLNAPPTWVLALVIVPATVVFVWWSYSGLSRLERHTRITLSVLRWLAVAFCLLLLFQPAFEITTYRKTQNQVHVLIDDSASMMRKDSYPGEEQRQALANLVGGEDVATLTRQDLVRKVLDRPDGLLARLRTTHDVRLFRVQRKPAPIRTLDELTGRGNRTSLGDALDLHLGAAGGTNLDSVILVSDGRNNAGLDPTEVARTYALRGITIHTIGIGDPEPPRNAWLVGPPGPKEALREEEVGFDVTLRAEGLRGRRATVELHGSRDGGPFAPLATANGELPADGDSVKVRVFHAFQEAGDWTLKFVLTPQPEESQLDDNEDTRFLRVNDEKIRVLYIEERPRWEYRYVKTCLKRVDPSIQMQSVLFEASPKFEQEHSADLPALRDLPRTEKELLQYHCILFGDVSPERIAATEDGIRQWLELLVKYVEFGGGVGFLCGIGERYTDAAAGPVPGRARRPGLAAAAKAGARSRLPPDPREPATAARDPDVAARPRVQPPPLGRRPAGVLRLPPRATRQTGRHSATASSDRQEQLRQPTDRGGEPAPARHDVLHGHRRNVALARSVRGDLHGRVLAQRRALSGAGAPAAPQ